MSLPTSVFSLNSTPRDSKYSRRLTITDFSSLNDGMPKVSKPPISGFLSNTTGVTPLRIKISAQPSPAGPAPMMATLLPVCSTIDKSGRQPIAKALSVTYFSTLPIVTAPNSSLMVQEPSHSRSCGHTRPQTSGRVFVSWHSSAASMIRPCFANSSQSGM